MNSTSKTEHKTEYDYTLVNQAINILKSNKGLTKEIEHVSNNNRQIFKERKTLDRKMNKQKIWLNCNSIITTDKHSKREKLLAGK